MEKKKEKKKDGPTSLQKEGKRTKKKGRLHSVNAKNTKYREKKKNRSRGIPMYIARRRTTTTTNNVVSSLAGAKQSAAELLWCLDLLQLVQLAIADRL